MAAENPVAPYNELDRGHGLREVAHSAKEQLAAQKLVASAVRLVMENEAVDAPRAVRHAIEEAGLDLELHVESE